MVTLVAIGLQRSFLVQRPIAVLVASKVSTSMTSASNHNSGCLASLFRFFGGGSSSPRSLPNVSNEALTDVDLFGPSETTFPYGIRDHFLSPTELAFYHVLSEVVQSRVVICTKVRLADIFFVTRPHENRGAFNRIAQKHIDFLLCDRVSLRPLFGIELDDSSHTRLDRQERDNFVDKACAASNLPLLHIRAQRTYLPDQVAAYIAPFLGQVAQPVLTSGTTPSSPSVTLSEGHATPICSNCGIPMVVRTATQGLRQGKQFYGCTNYPRCHAVQPLG